MKSKILAVGILVTVLAFGVMVIGCDSPEDGDDTTNGYTYEFKVANVQNPEGVNYNISGVTKIEFFNGQYNMGDPVLKTLDVSIPYNQTSEVYKVSGFTESLFSIRVYFTSGGNKVGTCIASEKNNQKYLIEQDEFSGGYLSIHESSW